MKESRGQETAERWQRDGMTHRLDLHLVILGVDREMPDVI